MTFILRLLGIGAIVTGGLMLAVTVLAAMTLLGPLVFWLAWNVLGLGPSIGLPELGFWAIVLATAFLVLGWLGKVVITGIVFLVDPAWLDRAAEVRWPEPTLRNFVAIALLAALAARPHAQARKAGKRGSRD